MEVLYRNYGSCKKWVKVKSNYVPGDSMIFSHYEMMEQNSDTYRNMEINGRDLSYEQFVDTEIFNTLEELAIHLRKHSLSFHWNKDFEMYEIYYDEG